MHIRNERSPVRRLAESIRTEFHNFLVLMTVPRAESIRATDLLEQEEDGAISLPTKKIDELKKRAFWY